MSLDDFFGDEDTGDNHIIPENSISIDKKVKKNGEIKKKTKIKPMEEFIPTEFELGQDISNVFLLDVIYEPKANLAQCFFYDDETKSIFKWNDNTGHKPYFLTLMSQDTINQIDKIVKSKEFIKMEETEKFMLIEGQNQKFTKIYGTNPLAIGGRPTSFREFVDPAYEADIRYHFNYVADMRITPGSYYNIINGNIVSSSQEIDPLARDQLLKEFEGENQDQLDMLEEYMPLLFQNIPDIFRCAFDIEVGSERGKMPNPNNPLEEIISIAVVDSDDNKICWVLNTPYVNQDVTIEDIKIKRFDVELELIDDFFHHITKYPIVLSFNGDNFDGLYLVNRALRLGMKKEDIPFNIKRNEISLKDSVHIDLYRFFRQAAIRIYAFGGRYDKTSLEELSTALLGEGKLTPSEKWINEMDLQSLVKYNVRDSKLTLKLTQFDDNIVLNLMFVLMRICKMPLFDFTRIAVSGWLQMWLVYEHRKRNFLIPRKEDISESKGDTATSNAIIAGKKYQGAIVLDPKPGIWWDVQVLDFASLYPSIIKTRNLSYETIRCHHVECRSNKVPEVGHWTCTKRNGIFAIILGFIRDTRVKWFKPRSGDPSIDPVERRNSDVIQSSLKVLINAGYGVFGSVAFDFYCLPVAESTTAYARDAIKSLQSYVEDQLGLNVLYGDTDSVFIHQPTPANISQLIEWGDENIGVELGTDYEFRYVVFSDRKKNYFGITNHGNVIVKGLMGKKSNTPQIIREHFSNVLDILKQVHKPQDFENAKNKIKKLLQQMIVRLENNDFTIEDASIRMSLSRNLREYGTWTQTVQAVTQLLESKIIAPNSIGIGDTVEFIKVSSPIRVKIPQTRELSFPPETRSASVIPVQLVDSERDLDGKPIIDAAESTFSQLLITLDMSWDNIMGVQSLDDFF